MGFILPQLLLVLRDMESREQFMQSLLTNLVPRERTLGTRLPTHMIRL